jgi:glycerol-3-phosphate dehydrogenase (NAD(P)+)
MVIGVLGSGSFGTALAVHFAGSGHDVVLWARRPELAAELEASRINERYLPGVVFPPALVVSSNLRDLATVDTLVVGVPSHGVREVLDELWTIDPRHRVVVSAAKGIENDTLERMSEVTAAVAAAHASSVDFAVFSGPSFAGELAAGTPTVAVVASTNQELAQRLQRELTSPTLRLYSSTDVVGVELGGAAKNIIAIASGMAIGLGFGQNTLAALITRGLHEITRLGLACGGDPRTFSGLAGLGDLVLTCTGGASRNRRAGLALAERQSLWQLEAETGMVAEGVRTSLAIQRLAARHGVEMPITDQIVAVIYHDKDPRRSVGDLMQRGLKSETEL